MRLSFEKPLVIALAFVFIAGTAGCQSGYKFHNPFSKTPKAENAKAPSELDELDELDDLTPPPENYTKGESDSKKSSFYVADFNIIFIDVDLFLYGMGDPQMDFHSIFVQGYIVF